ncbi:MAG: hypothetical protein K6E97_08620 [Treponema sp.]|nr:hypothetical protein [Treponema sp.]
MYGIILSRRHNYEEGCFLFFFLLCSFNIFAQNIGDKVYKEVEVNGEKLFKWLLYETLNEYNSDEKIIHKLTFEEKVYKSKYETGITAKTTIKTDWWYEYDVNGNLIHSKSSKDEEEWWYEYDSNGKEIHGKNSKGLEYWKEYDSKGNMIHEKNSNNIDFWHEYNSEGKEIHGKNSKGLEWWYEYNSKGKCVHTKYSDGKEWWYEYDSKGFNIHTRKSDGTEWFFEYEFYSNGKMKSCKYFRTI